MSVKFLINDLRNIFLKHYRNVFSSTCKLYVSQTSQYINASPTIIKITAVLPGIIFLLKLNRKHTCCIRTTTRLMEEKNTYHFLHKLVVNGVFQKQSASCDAVLSLVEEH